MAGSFRGALLALFALLVVTASAEAFGGRWGWRPFGTFTCPPPPAWHGHVPATAPCWAPPALPQAPLPKVKALANPLPAAAPTAKEPPLRAPAITESRSLGGVMPAQAIDVAPGRCKVGFWNITGADVTLTIDGQTRTLPKDRAVTIELNRSFVWQIDGRSPQTELVPVGQNIFEVILRQ